MTLERMPARMLAMRHDSPHAEVPHPLDPRQFAADPLVQFERWYALANEAAVAEPDAMALATATPDGRPSLRWVLFKGIVRGGFSFYTHYRSRKGGDLAANPRAALGFYWEPLGRQVRVEGSVERLPAADSDAYFRTRPPGSRLSAAISPQSQVIPDRLELERRVAELETRHPHGDIPRPEDWGGYRVTPDAIEFWQQRPNRLHDRLRYVRGAEAWRLERLAP